MKTILDLVKQALDTGYLTREAEDNLRRMLTHKYSDEELDAFISLQQAAMKGQVRQESRETLVCQG